MRAKVEHPFLINAELRIHQDPLPGNRQEPQPPQRAVRLGELGDAGPCRRPDGVTASASLPETPQNHPEVPPQRPKQRLLSSSCVPGCTLRGKQTDDKRLPNTATLNPTTPDLGLVLGIDGGSIQHAASQDLIEELNHLATERDLFVLKTLMGSEIV